MKEGPLIIAIDGPSGVGKSTVGQGVAKALQLPFLETGAMYRALGWSLLTRGIDPHDQTAVEEVAAGLDLALEVAEDGDVEVLLEGRPLDMRVRTPEVSEHTSIASSYPGVRRRMVAVQRGFARRHGAVVEGRDIGTRVFPETPFKFFLSAPLKVRVARRLRQLEAAGEQKLSAAEIEAEVADRDRRDRSRKESPLTLDASYTCLDTGEMSAAQVIRRIVEQVEGSSNRSRARDC